MFKFPSRYFILTAILTILTLQSVKAGPPFNTDDPQPVDLHHWEYYIASVSTFTANASTGTSPHIELNYGAIPDVQLHLILPLNYESTTLHGFHAGYANTEVGLKYRFIQETDNMPQIGTFPILEIPTIHNPEFGNGQVQLFIPVWLQKSWGKLTSYGGAGYWINPGTGNRNWLFAGWEVQYDFSKVITLGAELYYHTPDTIVSNPVAAFNAGGSINPSDKFHIIFSVGHSLVNEPFSTTYVGLLWTI